MAGIRPSKGELTVYVEHGVWYDAASRTIHVTVPAAKGVKNPHWSYSVKDRQYAIYERILRDQGRWPADGRSALDET
jgi:hypothetical protein